ncbi:MAG: hypothetical protein CM1200mP9_11710 [Gammaproteobacteria bacterium]|nr:MAG: hypothetical protein CM1200mP9_11710 [Gammaproteobacteria bacterium]
MVTDSAASWGKARSEDGIAVMFTTFPLLSSLAFHYGFELETPFGRLKKKHREAILYGSGEERIDFSYVNDRGDVIRRRHRFEGVLPNMERRFHETESNVVRENLQKYLTVKGLPLLSWYPIAYGSRHVFIDGTALPE